MRSSPVPYRDMCNMYVTYAHRDLQSLKLQPRQDGAVAEVQEEKMRQDQQHS